jgi:hypothetical protein
MSRSLLKQKPINLLIIVTLALLISAPIVLPHQVAAQTGGYYNRTFSWDYGGKHWDWNLSIPQDLYNAYRSVPVSTRTRDGPSGYDMMVTTEEPFIQNLASKLNSTTTQLGYSSIDQANFVLAFVQSITYNSDLNTTGYEEYPRFPIETLVDQTGDCDCKAILYATLTLSLGYGAVFINPTDHLAVGVLGDNLKGTYWSHNNQTYYYAETTGTGFTIGQLPDEFSGKTAYVYDIDQSKQFIPNIKITPTTQPSLTNGQSTTTLPTPTLAPLGPTPTSSAYPTISEPSVQPVLPLSFNLISDNPLLFILIAFAIAVSISVTIWSVRKPKQSIVEASATPEPNTITQTEPDDLKGDKFCIFCGSSNKTFAVFCEKCGKQIGQQSA